MIKFKYLIGHWVGVNSHNVPKDKPYHEVVDKDGKIHKGVSLTQFCIAATGGMNSITCNIACTGGIDPNGTLTPIQSEAFFKRCAELLKENGQDETAFYTHYEIGQLVREYKKGSKTSIINLLPWNQYLDSNVGKIDLTRLPAQYGATAETSGGIIRNKIKWYIPRV